MSLSLFAMLEPVVTTKTLLIGEITQHKIVVTGISQYQACVNS